VIAVHASRGGAGCTFVATHLAQAFARRGTTCVLVDADPIFGDVATALGATGEDVRTLAELAPVADELTWEHLEGVTHAHGSGIRALLAPPPAEGVDHRPLIRRAVDVAASASDAVIVHVPRELDPHVQACLSEADHVLEVLTLDILSFRATSRMLEVVSPLALEDRLGLVVNRAGRAELAPGDVQRVFGREPVAVIGADPSVTRAQDHGRLLSTRGRIGRSFDRLAARFPPPGEHSNA
jgi:Flp pilus assembly CpaE family ATPase